jgi:hypothetical protein
MQVAESGEQYLLVTTQGCVGLVALFTDISRERLEEWMHRQKHCESKRGTNVAASHVPELFCRPIG